MTGDRKYGVAIIGCGNVGERRASAAAGGLRSRLVVCVDVSEDRAKALAKTYKAEYGSDWRQAVSREDVDIVVISTANHMHAPIGVAAMENGKHVLCENPLARNPSEAETIVVAAEDNKVKLKTGFNHRFNNAVMKARELLQNGSIGEVVFIRGWTGRGGWETPAQTWFVDPELSGGGTLMDNGQNLIDLSRWFMGAPFVETVGYRATNVWPVEPVEDNAFMLLRTSDNRVAELHSSWTQWAGYLCLDISGTDGYITIDYDNSITRLGTRTGRWAAVEEQVFDFSTVSDESWMLEWREFTEAVHENRQPYAGGSDGWRAVMIAYAVYESSETGKAVELT